MSAPGARHARSACSNSSPRRSPRRHRRIPPQPGCQPRELGELVKLGKTLFEETGTHPLTRGYVGNALSCASCSMNGMRPPTGSKPSLAITAYLTWLSTGIPIAMNSEVPFGPHATPRLNVDLKQVDLEAGKRTYEAKCASCHGEDGQGDPPVWGARSYNAGAGLALVPRLASWLHVTMPPDDPLTEEEGRDVAAYVDAQPRPDFVLRDHLPPGEAARGTLSQIVDEVVRAPTWPPRR